MEMRLTFNEDEINYERFRPRYVSELFQDVIRYSGLQTEMRALEIGIGTGQATEPFLNAGCFVDAVELGEKLAVYSVAKFSAYPRLHVIQGDFCKVNIDNDAYDLLYSATTFHWLPEEAGFAKARRVLKPGGAIALFWNHPYPNRQDDPSNVANRRVYDKYRPSDKEPKEFSEEDCNKYPALLEKYGFTDIQVKLYQNVRTLSAEDYIGLINTYSDHRVLPEDLKTAFERDMLSSIRKVGGFIRIYDTMDLYLAKKP